MNELIRTTQTVMNGETTQTVNARELHAFLESRQQFSHWIKDRIEKYGFIEGQDFTVDKKLYGKKGQFAPTEYTVSLDMAKELAMVENNEKGRQARQYFVELERRYKGASITAEAIVAAMTPIIREREQLRAQFDIARHFLPHGKPGELNNNGDAKNNFRRGYYTAGKGRPTTLLLAHPTLPGMFEEIQLAELKQIGG